MRIQLPEHFERMKHSREETRQKKSFCCEQYFEFTTVDELIEQIILRRPPDPFLQKYKSVQRRSKRNEAKKKFKKSPFYN